MAKGKGVFQKRRLTPGQLRSVAERRFGDAVCLLESGQNARATGAMYVAGFTVECLLKALLLERHPNLRGPLDPSRLSRSDKDMLEMLYRHDLDKMLVLLPELEPKLVKQRSQRGTSIWKELQTICEQWTIYARYSSTLAKVEDARRFIDAIREVKQFLEQP